MKKVLIMAAVAVIVIAMAGVAAAVTTPLGASVNVQATVSQQCRESAHMSDMSIAVDPTLGDTTFTPATDESVKCASGARTYSVKVAGTNANAAGVACGNGAGAVTDMVFSSGGNPDFMYTIACTGASVASDGTFNGQGNTAIPLGVEVMVTEAEAYKAAAAVYSDNITFTIEY